MSTLLCAAAYLVWKLVTCSHHHLRAKATYVVIVSAEADIIIETDVGSDADADEHDTSQLFPIHW